MGIWEGGGLRIQLLASPGHRAETAGRQISLMVGDNRRH
jgi:hypothetical protein